MKGEEGAVNDATESSEVITPKPSDKVKGQSVDDGEENGSDITKSIKTPSFPIFWLTEPTIEYWATLVKCADDMNINWQKITCNSPTREQVPANIKAKHLPETELYPFLNSTLTDVLECWRDIIRPKGDSIELEPYARFTFLIVDEECVEASPYELIKVCTDAPDEDDFEENDSINEPKLKILSLGLFEAFGALKVLDTLSATPSEVLRSLETETELILCSMPPFIMKANPNRSEGRYIVISPTEARLAKQRALKMRPEKVEDTVLDEEREGAVLYLANAGSVFQCTEQIFFMDCISRRKGTLSDFVDNRLLRVQLERGEVNQIDTDVARMMRKRSETPKD